MEPSANGSALTGRAERKASLNALIGGRVAADLVAIRVWHFRHSVVCESRFEAAVGVSLRRRDHRERPQLAEIRKA